MISGPLVRADARSATDGRPSTTRPLRVLGVPSSAGAYGPGQERAPAVLRERGLVTELGRSRPVVDGGDVAGATFRRNGPESFNNVEAVAEVAGSLRGPVAESLEAGEDILVLGGDCTVELGVVAGALRASASVALVYVDLDADLTTGTTGDGILDWMGVAHMLGVRDTHPALVQLGPRNPMLAAGDIALVSLDRATDDERSEIERRGVAVESLDAVRNDLGGVLTRLGARFSDRDIVLVHVDVDVLKREELSIADNDRYVDGLHPDELEALLEGLMSMHNARVLTLAEVNPDRAVHEAAAVDRVCAMLVRACG